MNLGVLAHLQSVTGGVDLAGTPYRLIRPLGRGGMGVVYLIEDPRLRREAALKVLDVPNEAQAARLELEARVIARLEHPGIVPVHDVGRLADGRVYYVMKFVRGERLDAWLAKGPPVNARVRVFQRICEAVGFAHAQGVVHRDLKPQNVMMGEYGEALVMDWGLARELGEPGSDTLDGAVFGTPGFMAPEQARGEPADARADVFALGAVLHFLFAQRPPFEGTTVAEVLQRTKDQPPVPFDAPPPLKSIAAKALTKDAGARYPDARPLAADVAAWLDGAAVTAHRETLGERLTRWYTRYQVLILLIAAYLVMRTLVAVLARK